MKVTQDWQTTKEYDVQSNSLIPNDLAEFEDCDKHL